MALKELRASGLVSGPFRDGRSTRYFVAKHAPSLKKVAAQLEAKLLEKGLKLSSLSELEESVKGPLKALFKDAFAALKSERKIVEFRGPRRSRLFVHCEPLRDQIPLDEVLHGHNGDRAEETISLERLRPIYNALKAEQGGISAVKISDIWKKFGGSRDRLHKLLLDEAKKGRVGSVAPGDNCQFWPGGLGGSNRISRAAASARHSRLQVKSMLSCHS